MVHKKAKVVVVYCLVIKSHSAVRLQIHNTNTCTIQYQHSQLGHYFGMDNSNFMQRSVLVSLPILVQYLVEPWRSISGKEKKPKDNSFPFVEQAPSSQWKTCFHYLLICALLWYSHYPKNSISTMLNAMI